MVFLIPGRQQWSSTVCLAIERAGVYAVIMVNDFGQAGIDGTLMVQYGSDIIGLARGHVHCTLGHDLIVVELTGVADWQGMIKALNDNGNRLAESTRTIVMVDSSRFDVIIKALHRLKSALLRSTDIILQYMTDLVSDPELRRMVAVLRLLNHKRPMLCLCALEGENMDRLVDPMMDT